MLCLSPALCASAVTLPRTEMHPFRRSARDAAPDFEVWRTAESSDSAMPG